VELCGELIFVSLAKEGPSLAEFLGPYFEIFAGAFGSPYRQAWTYDATYEANWKVFIENTLESYHVPTVHPNTLKTLPPEEQSFHELNERYTWYRLDDPSLGVLAWCARRFGLPATYQYEHHTVHPNIDYIQIDTARMLMTVVPVTPTTCRHRVLLYTVRGEKPGYLREGLGWLLSRAVTAFLSKVNLEDVRLYPQIQRGIEASHHPGVIGTREERIYVFQKYIVDRCADTAGAAEDLPLRAGGSASVEMGDPPLAASPER
jgi:phenylpropionate dioxygenase-like ring-hydroxylating dioxygenase large terminal subunit